MIEIPTFVMPVLEGLNKAGFKAYLVGGCLRDCLLGKTPNDYDVATNARPEQVQALFPRVIPTGIQHGTVTVVSNGLPVEVTTFRSEGEYTDGRRPDCVEFEGEVEVDLSRRDFTINAMAYDPVTKTLVDPFGGKADLDAKIVRCVRDPQSRFLEDGLRTIRAIRFATVLDFNLDEATFDAIKPALGIFKKVAIERVQVEFVKILMSGRPSRGMQLLNLSGLLGAFLPSANPFAPLGATMPDLHVRLAVLLEHDERIEETLVRMKFPTIDGVTATKLWAYRNRPVPTPVDSDATLRVWMAFVGRKTLDKQLEVLRALKKIDPEVADRIRAIEATKPPLSIGDLAMNGNDVRTALALDKPGPMVGEALRRLMDAVLLVPSLNTREGLVGILRSMQCFTCGKLDCKPQNHAGWNPTEEGHG